jgi:hypothetical protein
MCLFPPESLHFGFHIFFIFCPFYIQRSVVMKDFLEKFHWHSSIGIDDSLENNKRFVTKIANNQANMMSFEAAGENYLIHKTTNALWRKSECGNFIEPVFGSDILTDDDLNALGSEE